MSEQIQVFMPKENADELKAKYGLSDETLQEVIGNLKVVNPPSLPETVEEEAESGLPPMNGPDIFAKIGKGEITMGEALIYLDYIDRKDERRKATQNNLKPEQITEAVVKGIEKAFPAKRTTDDEIPGWAKDLQADMKDIKEREQKKEEDARVQESVQRAVQPVQDKLNKTAEELAKVKEEREKESATPKKGELETTKDTLKTLQEIDDLRNKPKMPENAKEVMIDLNEEIATALGEELKKTVVEAVREKISGADGGAALSETSEGKIQVNWYNLGTRALKTLEKFIEKLPVSAPPKGTVKEMPPSKPPQLPPPPPSALPPPPPPLPATPPPTLPPPTTPTETPPQAEVAPSSPPATEELATATETEKTTEPQTPSEKPEKTPKTAKRPQKPSKKNEEEEKAQDREKTIIAESTTEEAVVEQKTGKTGGSEETLDDRSHTEDSRGEPAKSN